MAAQLPRPTTNPYATDPSPEATRLALLTLLADESKVHRWGGITSRAAGRLLYGTDLAGASRIASAMGYLHNAKLIERCGAHGGSRRFRITLAGRASLALVAELDRDLPPCAQETTP